MDEYATFLQSKIRLSAPVGFNPGTLAGSGLADFQAQIDRWALRRGRAAIFADTGLGKTRMQLVWGERVAKKACGRVLILAPLAVAEQTVAEGAAIGVRVEHSRRGELPTDARLIVTNYERLQHFSAADFVGVVLDESSILKSYDGKTRTQIIETFSRTPYRLACTATPAPNDHQELGNHSEFLGVMPRTEMLAEFFCHDGGETSVWRLKGHAEAAFWRWLCSWAVVVRKPSDLGFDDTGYDLPPLRYHEHVVEVEPQDIGMLFPEPAATLEEQRAARRGSIGPRVKVAAELVSREPAEQWLVWCDLNAESEALTRAISGAVEVTGSDDIDEKEERLKDFAAGRIRVLVSKPSICGHGLNFQRCARTVYVGVTHSFEAFYQSVRRFWRFGQTRAVDCHVVTAETEGHVLQSLREKERRFEEMSERTVALVRDLERGEVRAAHRELLGYDARQALEVPTWLA
jgi:hypothetical protein